MQAISEIELLEKCTRGDKDAFASIVQRYQNLVCSVAYSVLGDFSRSEDVGQETLVAAWKQLSELKDLRKFRSWISSIARNQARTALRQERTSSNLVDQIETHAADPAEVAISQEEEGLVWDTLQSLPETYREPLVLFYRQDQSVADVASSLDLTEDNVKQRLRRGRELLRTEVAGIVERTLRNSIPGKAFTAAVMGTVLGLGSASASAAVAGAAGKVSTPIVIAAAKTGLLAGLTGTVVGIAGAMLGPRVAWKNARYESERQLIKDMSRKILLVVLGTIIPMLLVAFLWPPWEAQPLPFVATVITMTLLQLVLILSLALTGQREWKRLLTIELQDGTQPLPQTAMQRWLSRIKGRRWTSKTTFLGLPLVQIAMHDLADHWQMKTDLERPDATARAWVAVGEKAYGVLFAMGSVAVGGVAFGAISIGVVAIGGIGLGLLTVAGLGVGAVSIGGVSLGVFSYGGMAAGWLAFGGGALAWKCAVGGGALAREFAVGGAAHAAEANNEIAKQFVESHAFFQMAESMATSPIMILLASIGWTIPFAMLMLIGYRYQSPEKQLRSDNAVVAQ